MQAICHQVRSRNHTHGQQAFCPAFWQLRRQPRGAHSQHEGAMHAESTRPQLRQGIAKQTCCFMLIMMSGSPSLKAAGWSAFFQFWKNQPMTLLATRQAARQQSS